MVVDPHAVEARLLCHACSFDDPTCGHIGRIQRDIGQHATHLGGHAGSAVRSGSTKLVGLITLPGAMVGLLLAGADPLEAVIVQLLVMDLMLGTVALSVLAAVASSARQAVTPDLRLAEWVGAGSV
ncbi:MAG: ABC transporter permease [Acidimicrobiia bacterium]